MSYLPDGVTQDDIDRYLEGDDPRWELQQEETKPCACHHELRVSEAGEQSRQDWLGPCHSGEQPGDEKARPNLQSHTKEIGKTLAPEYGPESPGEAIDRLLEYYLKHSHQDRTEIAAVMIAELVTLKTMRRSLMRVLGGKEA